MTNENMKGKTYMATGTFMTFPEQIKSLEIRLKDCEFDNVKLIYEYKKVVTAEKWDQVKKKLKYYEEME